VLITNTFIAVHVLDVIYVHWANIFFYLKFDYSTHHFLLQFRFLKCLTLSRFTLVFTPKLIK
jgi:hypothetical protein